MKRLLIIMAALVVAAIAFAEENGKQTQLRFPGLPFADGKLFVSVSCGDTTILARAVDIQEETVSIPADLCAYYGKEIQVRAFQDLNENDTLDFDNYGRPQEPCLQANVTPDAVHPIVELKLVQY